MIQDLQGREHGLAQTVSPATCGFASLLHCQHAGARGLHLCPIIFEEVALHAAIAEPTMRPELSMTAGCNGTYMAVAGATAIYWQNTQCQDGCL